MTEPIVILADPVAIVINHLLAQPEITALVATRVYGKLPAGVVWPAVRVSRYGGAPAFHRPRILDVAELQLDAFGPDHSDAATSRLAETCCAVLTRLEGTRSADWTVTAVEFGQMANDPDNTFTPARPRTRADLTVYVRSR